MALRLQLDNGKAREYQTWQVCDGGEYRPTTYKTKCGIKHIYSAEEIVDCDHIDCAIGISLGKLKSHRLAMLICTGASLACFLVFSPISLFIAMFTSVTAIHMWKFYKDDCKEHGELIEFRDCGTIGGIKARKIED